MKKLILLSRVDREDLWVSTGIAFPNTDNIEFHEEFYLKNKDKIESQEVLDRIGDPLDYSENTDDYEDKNFKFKKSYYKYKIFFVYENESGEEIELSFQMDKIDLVD